MTSPRSRRFVSARATPVRFRTGPSRPPAKFPNCSATSAPDRHRVRDPIRRRQHRRLRLRRVTTTSTCGARIRARPLGRFLIVPLRRHPIRVAVVRAFVSASRVAAFVVIRVEVCVASPPVRHVALTIRRHQVRSLVAESTPPKPVARRDPPTIQRVAVVRDPVPSAHLVRVRRRRDRDRPARRRRAEPGGATCRPPSLSAS